jgi:hypothetical protein
MYKHNYRFSEHFPSSRLHLKQSLQKSIPLGQEGLRRPQFDQLRSVGSCSPYKTTKSDAVPNAFFSRCEFIQRRKLRHVNSPSRKIATTSYAGGSVWAEEDWDGWRSKLLHAATFLACNRKVAGSNPGRNTYYIFRGLPHEWGKCRDKGKPVPVLN